MKTMIQRSKDDVESTIEFDVSRYQLEAFPTKLYSLSYFLSLYQLFAGLAMTIMISFSLGSHDIYHNLTVVSGTGFWIGIFVSTLRLEYKHDEPVLLSL